MSTLLPNGETIPLELRQIPHWVCWKSEQRNGDKPTKVPYVAITGQKASTTDPKTWISFADALATYQRGGYDGIGFVFAKDGGLVGVDLDDCIGDDGSIGEEAWKIIREFDSYSEISPSGHGVKIFAKGSFNGKGKKVGDLEIYQNGRYFTVTGRHLEGCSKDLRECGVAAQRLRDILEERSKCSNGKSLDSINTNSSGFAGSNSLDLTDILNRARKYVATLDPSIETQDGSGRAYHCACVLIEGFGLSIDQARPIFETVFNPRCRPPWSDREIDHKLADAEKNADLARRGYLLRNHDPRDAQKSSGTNEQSPNEGASSKRPTYYTATSLAEIVIPEIRWAIPLLIPEGQSVLGGRPKSGKSWAALNLSVSVATGEKALGKFPTVAGDVLYIGAEDSLARLQGRLKAIRRGSPMPERLTVTCEFPKLDNGGYKELDAWLAEHPGARLIVLDTLKKLCPPKPHGMDEYTYSYEVSGRLQTIALKAHCAILCVLHTKKGETEDFTESVMGSTGWISAADSVLVLKRLRASNRGILD